MFTSSCARNTPLASIPSQSLPGTDGVMHPLVDPAARVTVVEFFSAHCPCQAQHDDRLRALIRDEDPRGVAFRIVSSEAEMSLASETTESTQRRYGVPILHDEAGHLARAVGAEFATFSLVLDHDGRVLYRGGIDSDELQLHDDATPYLRTAIDAAIGGKPLARTSSKTLGCSLAL